MGNVTAGTASEGEDDETEFLEVDPFSLEMIMLIQFFIN